MKSDQLGDNHQAVARRQCHLIQIGGVPRAKQDAPVIWPRPGKKLACEL